MTPYYDEGGITIYHGDCREVLPELRADVVVSDPPYGVNVDYGTYQDTPENLRALMSDVLPMMRSAAPLVAFTSGVKAMYDYPAPSWVMCWFEPAGTGVGPWGFCTWQPILCYGSDPFAGKGSRPDGFTASRSNRPIEDRFDSDHPVPKPLAVGRWMIDRLCPEPATIIDPFMGGGSFLRSARDLGHRAIGIEIEERYCEIAVQRLAQGVLEFG